ncbi:PIF-6 [Crangon crangon nudivirus]|uniref:PIF-6 n=1 Tax=Crangon crangon nudivirus TaxID=2880838 RepID=A0AAE8Y503_9VIRU|nr:PIF-6 [Crangon crangon nudivirus]UBZ25570.1 PIF-6 [Crangon crangon nudivirus]
MQLTKEYLAGLLERNIIPVAQWSYKIIDNVECFHIKNPVYCNVFWVDMWYYYLAEKFKMQAMVTNLQDQDLTVPVILSVDLRLISAPISLQNVYYYATQTVTTAVATPFIINISSTSVLIISLIVFLCIIGVTFNVPAIRNSPYSMYL